MDSGIGMHVGDVDLKFSGELNAFYVHDRGSHGGPAVIGGLADSTAVSNSSIREGLLPSDFNVTASTRQRGLDITVDFGFYPGINSQAVGLGGFYVQGGQTTGFGTPGIDMRQQYATVGNKHIGTFKIGRDIGLFGQEAILNDFTILAVGTPNGNVHPGSVSLGRIGVGYIYTDFIPQISYTTPSMGGLTAGFAVVQPFDNLFSTGLNAGLDTGLSATLTGHGQPMFQAKLAYAIPTKGPVKANLWLNGITQSQQAADAAEAAAIGFNVGQKVRAAGFDGGFKLTAGPASIVAYGYNCRGIGQEGLLFLSTDPLGHPRETRGGYIQGTYALGRTTFGFSYGASHLSLTDFDKTSPTLSSLLKSNSSEVAQLRYALTKWVTPIAEYTHTRSTTHNSSSANTEDSVALGAIVFF
jgi:predicted porin